MAAAKSAATTRVLRRKRRNRRCEHFTSVPGNRTFPLRHTVFLVDTSSSTQTRASDWSNLALYGFALVGWELILIGGEVLLPGGQGRSRLSSHPLGADGRGVGCRQCLLDATSACHGLARTPSAAVPRGGWIGALAVVAGAIAVRAWALGQSAISSTVGSAIDDYGSRAWVAVSAQIIYYMAEATLISIIIACGQRAGE